MTNHNGFASPQVACTQAGIIAIEGGLTKRELIAMYAMQAMISKLPIADNKGMFGMKVTDEDLIAEVKAAIAECSVEYADALLAELAKEPE